MNDKNIGAFNHWNTICINRVNGKLEVICADSRNDAIVDIHMEEVSRRAENHPQVDNDEKRFLFIESRRVSRRNMRLIRDCVSGITTAHSFFIDRQVKALLRSFTRHVIRPSEAQASAIANGATLEQSLRARQMAIDSATSNGLVLGNLVRAAMTAPEAGRIPSSSSNPSLAAPSPTSSPSPPPPPQSSTAAAAGSSVIASCDGVEITRIISLESDTTESSGSEKYVPRSPLDMTLLASWLADYYPPAMLRKRDLGRITQVSLLYSSFLFALILTSLLVNRLVELKRFQVIYEHNYYRGARHYSVMLQWWLLIHPLLRFEVLSMSSMPC
jgi:hypothetical protein